MDFIKKINTAISVAERALEAANDLKSEYEELKDFTATFLACCKKHGIKTVSINTYTEIVKSRKAWGKYCPNSAFADEREGTWPAIWAVCSEMGVGGGCGNGGQHQLDHDAKLIDGVYKLENGNWTRLESEGYDG